MPAKTVEDVGCDVGCMTLDKKSGEVVVARRDAIYTYHADGRGPPKAYESLKKMITAHGDYIGLACPPASSASKDPTAMRNRLGSGAGGIFNASTFVLLEPDLRIIGHTETLISPVKFVFEVWGDLFTVTEEGKVSHWLIVGRTDAPLTWNRYINITKRRYNRGWKCSIKETCILLRWSWHAMLGLIMSNRASSTASLAITYIKRATTTAPWYNTFVP